MIPVTALYASLLALLYVRRSLDVIRARIAAQISLGVGEDRALLQATRAHGNFAEYAPLFLVLIGCAELNGAHWAVLHALGLACLAGRILHPLGLSKQPEDFRPRRWGMRLTLYGLIAAAAVNLLMVAWNAVG